MPYFSHILTCQLASSGFVSLCLLLYILGQLPENQHHHPVMEWIFHVLEIPESASAVVFSTMLIFSTFLFLLSPLLLKGETCISYLVCETITISFHQSTVTLMAAFLFQWEIDCRKDDYMKLLCYYFKSSLTVSNIITQYTAELEWNGCPFYYGSMFAIISSPI